MEGEVISDAVVCLQQGRIPSQGGFGTQTGNLGKINFTFQRNPVYPNSVVNSGCKHRNTTGAEAGFALNQSEREATSLRVIPNISWGEIPSKLPANRNRLSNTARPSFPFNPNDIFYELLVKQLGTLDLLAGVLNAFKIVMDLLFMPSARLFSALNKSVKSQ